MNRRAFLMGSAALAALPLQEKSPIIGRKMQISVGVDLAKGSDFSAVHFVNTPQMGDIQTRAISEIEALKFWKTVGVREVINETD